MEFLQLLSRTGLIAAHRGNRAVAPENTLFAFEASVGRFDFIELDVQLSRDGVPVVIHDETLARTSDVGTLVEFGSRYPWKVSDFSLDELKTLDAGSWFYRDDPFGEIAKGCTAPSPATPLRIPTLEEVLGFAKAHDLLLNVEIKGMHDAFSDEEAVASVVGTVEKLQCADRVLLSSFYHPYLKRIKAAAPHLLTAALQESFHPPKVIDYLHELGVDAYHMDDAIATKPMVEMLKEAGFFVGVYTVNSLRRQQELFGWGVNALFTDYAAPGRRAACAGHSGRQVR
jgi:glycerophosphoryl diester phosphodiesterase